MGRGWRLGVALACGLVLGQVCAAERGMTVTVADPFLEVHTGPGGGYPVFHVIERGAEVVILKRKTDWFKVRTAHGREGWVERGQLEHTLYPSGKPVQVREVTREEYAQRRWEGGVTGGDFGGATVMSLHAGRSFTSNISAELVLSQALGDYYSSTLLNLNLLNQPFPSWRVSPFFALGLGGIKTEPRSTLVQAESSDSMLAHVGVGARAYLTRRFMARFEYNNYVLYDDKDKNGEIDEWKAGFAFFF